MLNAWIFSKSTQRRTLIKCPCAWTETEHRHSMEIPTLICLLLCHLLFWWLYIFFLWFNNKLYSLKVTSVQWNSKLYWEFNNYKWPQAAFSVIISLNQSIKKIISNIVIKKMLGLDFFSKLHTAPLIVKTPRRAEEGWKMWDWRGVIKKKEKWDWKSYKSKGGILSSTVLTRLSFPACI